MLTRSKLIENYGFDIEDVIKDDVLSPFELVGTLAIRDKLEREYNELANEERNLLLKHDTDLLRHAEKFYSQVSKALVFPNDDMPITHWWAHIDKVVSGELIVDLEHHEVRFRNNDIAATLTA